MQILECKRPIYFDVDDTLVLWHVNLDDVPKVKIISPPSKHFVGQLEEFEVPEYEEYLTPHLKHIEELKKLKLKGHTIIVWSQGGHDWAASVVKGLNLEEYVDYVIEKPTKYYDDLDSRTFMGHNIFIPYWEIERK